MKTVETIELSQRLAECVKFLRHKPPYDEISPDGMDRDEWADAIESIIIPPPGERDETEQTLTCTNCGKIAKLSSAHKIELVAFECTCGKKTKK